MKAPDAKKKKQEPIVQKKAGSVAAAFNEDEVSNFFNPRVHTLPGKSSKFLDSSIIPGELMEK